MKMSETGEKLPNNYDKTLFALLEVQDIAAKILVDTPNDSALGYRLGMYVSQFQYYARIKLESAVSAEAYENHKVLINHVNSIEEELFGEKFTSKRILKMCEKKIEDLYPYEY